MNINRTLASFQLFEKNPAVGETDGENSLKNGELPKKEQENKFDRLDRTQVPSLSDMQRLSPLNQYRYIDGQDLLEKPATLKVVPGNPEQTLTRANKVINEAILPPVFANPNRSKLTEALQLKRMASSLLDKAA